MRLADKHLKMSIGDVNSTAMLGEIQLGQTPAFDKSSQGSTDSDSKDQVKLSAPAQAQAMYSNGQSVTQIAAALGVSTKVASEYLGLSTSAEETLMAVAK